ncbi:MAG: hypothetical protein HQL99_03295 [Magnetococcales bacterium]|nr:hypothetical protein [Magnetococcales bacterium]
MGKALVRDGKKNDHQLEEEIGVEVKKLLRTDLSGTVATMARELSEEEQQMFSESYLGSAVELMIPSVGQERRLMARVQQTDKDSPVEPAQQPQERAKPTAGKRVKPSAKSAAKSAARKAVEPKVKKAVEPKAKKAVEPKAKKAVEPKAKKAVEPKARKQGGKR